MTKAEIVEKFRLLSFEEKCEVMLGIQDEFVRHWPAEQIAEFEACVERVRRDSEKGAIWDRVRQQLNERRG